MYEPGTSPMNWAVAFDESIEIIRATVSGQMTAEGLKAMAADLLEESRRRDNYRFLCDCRQAEVAINISEIYSFPAELRRLGVMSFHQVAIVYTPGPLTTPVFTFFDDRCHNSGLSQKTFTDYDLASLWLTGIDWTIVSSPTGVTM